jgi:hydrogenase expression/formation protein HypE
MSKFSLDVLKQRVFAHTQTDDPDVILGAVFGEDAALTRVGGDILASHLDPIVGAVQEIGWLAVHVTCNDIAATGIPPRWILPLVLVPRPEDETLLGEIMGDARRAADELGVSIIGGHTGYSAGLSRPLVAVTALGVAAGRQPVRTQGARVGDLVVVTKAIALEGTAILAHDFADVARQLGLGEEALAEARALLAQISCVPEALALADSGATSMHDVTRGGVLETLLEMAQLSRVMIEVDADLLPLPLVIARFAEAFEFDPLRMISSGTLAATIPPDREDEVRRRLGELGVPVAFVGTVSPGAGVRVRSVAGVSHYTDSRCEEDELARIWVRYPRG